MTGTSEEFLTVKQIQNVLDVSNASLSIWRSQDGAGPPWIKRAGRFLYPVEQFQTYLLALTGGVPVPRGLSHTEKLTLFGRLNNPAPTTRELATRLAAVEQALLALTQIFSIEPAPTKAVKRKIAKREATMRNAAKRKYKKRSDFPY